MIEELTRLKTPDVVRVWAQLPPTRLRVNTPRTSVATSIRLDPGETQAIALAKELRATATLIDERNGRRVAKQFGLDTFGTLAVLEFAAERRFLELTGPK